MENLKKQFIVLWIAILILSVAVVFLISRTESRNIIVDYDGMIFFERNGSYLFTNDDGGLYWYNGVEAKFYQLNEK